MKQRLQYIVLLVLLTGMFASCASGKRSGKKITYSPSPYVLTPDSGNLVHLDMVFHIPNNYFSKRSRLIILPQLLVNGTVKEEYIPLVLDAPIYGKKINRKKILTGYKDPYESDAKTERKVSRSLDVPYINDFQLPDSVEGGRIVAVVTTDGCEECSAIDTIDVASITNPVPKESFNLVWVEPMFVVRPKVMRGKGVANLQFAINQSDIDLSKGNNRSELEKMVTTLIPVLEDTLATLNSITIVGMASADGPLALNTTLARNRALSAKQWLIRQLNIAPDIQRLIFVGSSPEGWEPVFAAMVADENPDSIAVKEILEKYNQDNDDVQERYIRRLPCWNRIKTNYLQKDRKVEYVYAYTIKSFTTDAELLNMYNKRTDAFNEEELLRVATLTKSPDGKKEVYQTILKYFPQSQIAANNLAILYFREGKVEEAKKLSSQRAFPHINK